MRSAGMSRRDIVRAMLALLAGFGGTPRSRAVAEPAEIKLHDGVPVERVDFEAKGIEGWTTVDGQWAVEDMAGAPSGSRALVQRAAGNAFNVIVASFGPYSDGEVSVRFKPISGREDASGGIVFRFRDGKYYVVRANALEKNFRLYYYDRGRHELASAAVKAPALGQWHTRRVVASGDHLQAGLDGGLSLEHPGSRVPARRPGLWTTAESGTAVGVPPAPRA